MRPKFPGLYPTVQKVSALAGTGIAEAWTAMTAFHAALKHEGRLEALRAEQARRWFWSEVDAVLSEAIFADPDVAREASGLETSVVTGRALPHAAARELIRRFRGA
jgi:LAO/AO transport system kinase